MKDDGNILLRCENLSFGYEGRLALPRLSFTLRGGDYLCVFGENGSGKTTLLKGILGLIPPSGGSIVFSSRAGAGEAGYLPQEEAAKKDFPAAVSEVVMSAFVGKMGLRPFYSRAEKEIFRRSMERLGVWELRDRCFRELSGGQRRRVLIARALCASRTLLVLDEPASGLDPLAGAGLYGLLDELNQKEGITVIMVTHDAGEALSHGKTVLHLARKGYFFGGASEYRRSDFFRLFARGKESSGESADTVTRRSSGG
jgi:zinc transport system ATP-binding protein